MNGQAGRPLQVERFPEDLRVQLRVRAVERGTTLREEVIMACMTWLATDDEEVSSGAQTR